MKGRCKILLVMAVFAVLAAMVWVTFAWKRQPQYRGKTLSDWGAEFRFSRAGTLAHREAEAAICDIGTNALPFLLARVRYERPRWKVGVMGFERNPTEDAMTCFKVLGPRARAAIPELTWMLTNSATDEEAWKAATALAGVGSEGLPSLVAAMTNRRNRSVARVAAAYGIGDMGSNAAVAVSALVGCLQDRDIQVAICSAMALGRLGLQPEIAVPALANSLGSSDLQGYAVAALRQFGPNARSAVPDLVRMFDDPLSDIRRLASDALAQIAPEILTNRDGAERQ